MQILCAADRAAGQRILDGPYQRGLLFASDPEGPRCRRVLRTNQQLLDRTSHLGVALAPHDHPNLETVKAYQCGLACVMRSDHPLARKKRIQPADLRGMRVIASPESTPFGQTLRRAFGAAGADMHRDFECTSSTTACWFAQAGVGVAVVDQVAIAGGLLGSAVTERGSKTTGTVIGAAVGAVTGHLIDKSDGRRC